MSAISAILAWLQPSPTSQQAIFECTKKAVNHGEVAGTEREIFLTRGAGLSIISKSM